MRNDAGQIALDLAARAHALCRELLPNGRREGAEWVHASLAGTSLRSLSVRLTGAKAGVWADFAADARGDALDLVAYILFAGNKADALKWARAWLGMGGATPAAVARPAPAPAPAGMDGDEEQRRRQRAAFALFLKGQPALRDTPADLYLQGRGIYLAELARQPRSLRFHPAVFNTELKAPAPAMLAAIVSASGQHISTHRTWLAPDAGGVWRKAPLRRPKMALGSYAGGSIRLWRGASGNPLAAAETDTIVISEGIETGLSIAVACPEYRVLAAVSLSNLARIILPPNALDIIIAADNDTGNEAAEATLDRAVGRLLDEGRSVRIARSSIGKDFNNALLESLV